MAFLKFILIFFIVIYLFGVIGRFLLSRFVKKFQGNFEQQQKHYQNQNKQEGDITIKKPQDTEKIIDKSEGDYIDYEEIK